MMNVLSLHIPGDDTSRSDYTDLCAKGKHFTPSARPLISLIAGGGLVT
jgi:hypothetical protein